MLDQEPLDQLLRQSLHAPSAPTLSENFDQRLERRLYPRRRRAVSERFLVAYSLVSLAVCVGTMLAAGLSGWLILILNGVPLLAVGAYLRRLSTQRSMSWRERA